MPMQHFNCKINELCTNKSAHAADFAQLTVVCLAGFLGPGTCILVLIVPAGFARELALGSLVCTGSS